MIEMIPPKNNQSAGDYTPHVALVTGCRRPVEFRGEGNRLLTFVTHSAVGARLCESRSRGSLTGTVGAIPSASKPSGHADLGLHAGDRRVKRDQVAPFYDKLIRILGDPAQPKGVEPLLSRSCSTPSLVRSGPAPDHSRITHSRKRTGTRGHMRTPGLARKGSSLDIRPQISRNSGWNHA